LEIRNLLKYDTNNIFGIFVETCKKNYLSYAKSLAFRYNDKIKIHGNNECAFRWSCSEGHIEVAKFLIDLGENHGYNKINIHANNENAFRWTCSEGHIEVAKFLIDLGENHGYNKINIHVDEEIAFRHSCSEGQIMGIIKLIFTQMKNMHSNGVAMGDTSK